MSKKNYKKDTKNKPLPKGEIIIYRTPNKQVRIKVRLKKGTIWLSQKQVAELFSTQRPAITKHLNNIFKNKELNKKSVCSKMEHTAGDGKTYRTQFYNLDAIISVGYRVNSTRATQFRIWATQTLKEHLVKGYTINQRRLLKRADNLRELQSTITFLQGKARHKLLAGQTQEILDILNEYAKSITILEQYDANKLELIKGKGPLFVLTYEDCAGKILRIKATLIANKQAGTLFGQEADKKLEGIVQNLYQTFGGKELYKSIEKKSAHLLYLIIKDHPFVDGNKRIASLLFIYFLKMNRYLYKSSGEKKINDNALVALSLLVAISEPKEKETMIKIIMNLLA